MNFSAAWVGPVSRSNSFVGVRCTTTPNRGLTSFVLLPSLCSHSVLLRANSADYVFESNEIAGFSGANASYLGVLRCSLAL
jgi:hypothetical protein